jgi:hypothetical protein
MTKLLYCTIVLSFHRGLVVVVVSTTLILLVLLIYLLTTSIHIYVRIVFHEPAGPQATSQFEHSSIPGFLKRHFELDNYLTKRDAWAGAIEPALTQLNSPRTDCPMKLPDISLPQVWQASSPLGGQGEDEESNILTMGKIKDTEDENTGFFTSEAKALNNAIGSLIQQIRQRNLSGEAGL